MAWKTRVGAGMAAVTEPRPFTVDWDVAGTADAVGLSVRVDLRIEAGIVVRGTPRVQ